MRKKLIILFAFLLLLLTGLFLAGGRKTEIVYGKDGFSPAGIKITVGTKVSFVNKSDTDLWPASDIHPTNDIYPGFNSKKALKPGESWEFVFGKTGIWRYHNHLRPEDRGTVQVADAGSFLTKNTKDEDVLKECGDKADRDERRNCWIDYLETVVTKKGSEVALKTLRLFREKSPEFAADCHTISHSVGEVSYWAYAKDKKLPKSGEIAICGYGFIHGFMQEFGHHDKNFKSGAAGLCDYFTGKINYEGQEKSVDPMDQCYHGIGHGLAFYYTPDYWGRESEIIKKGAEDCRKLTEDPAKTNNCIYGLFGGVMNLYTGGHGFKIDLNLADPFTICRNQEADLKEACYDSMVPALWVYTENDIEKTLAFFKKVDDTQYLKQAMYNFGDIISPKFVLGAVSFKEALSSCQSLRGELVIACIKGFAEGLIRSGFPEKAVENSLQFCALPGLSAEQKDICFESSFKEMKLSYPEKYRENCVQKSDIYSKYCQ